MIFREEKRSFSSNIFRAHLFVAKRLFFRIRVIFKSHQGGVAPYLTLENAEGLFDRKERGGINMLTENFSEIFGVENHIRLENRK